MFTTNEINQKASDILNKEDLFEVPVDVDALAKFFKIEVTYSSPGDDGLSGMLAKNPDGDRIFVNDTHSAKRQRFSLAHELGHFFLHEGQEMFIDGRTTGYLLRASNVRNSDYNIEKEANEFAAALLMPTELVSSSLDKIKSDNADETIEILSNQFEVSKQAMSYRLLNLGYVF